VSDTDQILLIRLKSIGDVVFTLPAVNLMRWNHPRARLVFLTSKEHVPLLSGFSAVDEVLPLDRGRYRLRTPAAMWGATRELLRGLRGGRFRLVVDFQGYGETALFAWLTRAPQRWGSVYRPVRRWAYTQGVLRNDTLHPVDWNLALLTSCGLRAGPVCNEFHLPRAEAESAAALFARHGCDPVKPTLYLQPFTSSPQKNWPLEKYLALAEHWRGRGAQVLFGGGPADRDRLGPAGAAGFPVTAGVPLLTAAGLVQLSTVTVGGDTGLVHLAVALGKRVIMLMQHRCDGAATPYGHADWAVAPRPGAASVAEIELPALLAATAAALGECGATLHDRA
jgi:ADP-heptose:LPS heptosyltransferase